MLYTLNEVLQGRLFRVPPYQRGYSWTKKQRRDLFEDLRSLKKLKRDEHFMATLVLLDKRKRETDGGTDHFQIYDVVDGQQRLTTLVILLKSIEKMLRESHAKNLRKDNQTKEAEKIAAILVKEKNLILLQTNRDARNTLDAYLQYGEVGGLENATTLSQLREAGGDPGQLDEGYGLTPQEKSEWDELRTRIAKYEIDHPKKP
ncbi:MAG TPA: DUF262 domain-containing protein [Tepidisphaeraceae bacterium]|jgi:uncharacterized protein with ParB-like and HNH nuclease domain|nr:DUF262 domain-containing protein [Tepidisphaeraceae bacterium]